MTDIDNDTLRHSLAWGAIGFGTLAVLAPQVFGGIYGTHETRTCR